MGNGISSEQHAAVWRLVRSGDVAGLRSTLRRVPPELQHLFLEYEYDHSTPLTIVVQRGDVECLRILLGASVDVNRIDHDGLSPLQLAVKADKPAVVQLLVDSARVSCNATDPSGMTPLLAAAINGHVKVLEVLLHCDRINIFAVDSRERKDVIALVRKAYRKASKKDQFRFKACLDLIAKVCGWSLPLRLTIGIICLA